VIKTFLLLVSHFIMLIVGFSLGVYALPIIIASQMPVTEVAMTVGDELRYEGEFVRDLKDSDFLHWGEGKVTLTQTQFQLDGKLAPGPNYKLYFSPVFVETEMEFEQHKEKMAVAGDVSRFENVVVQLAEGVNPADYSAVIIWCEAFSEFITATRYELVEG
jgi:hypothetical protein